MASRFIFISFSRLRIDAVLAFQRKAFAIASEEIHGLPSVTFQAFSHLKSFLFPEFLSSFFCLFMAFALALTHSLQVFPKISPRLWKNSKNFQIPQTRHCLTAFLSNLHYQILSIQLENAKKFF